ncbi:MAG: 3-hydroxyacyl-CoA dehydrogenase family protein [Hyphomicrobiales bacterium]|nr:3-hydroxyacyl-CoA dehydrogenase family protein [Hyphomicrobiales bacterium]
MSAIRSIAVIGAGTMGHALALVHALGGCEVQLQDTDPARLEAAPKLIGAALETLGEAGGGGVPDAAAVLDRIAMGPELENAVASADLVVEAVVEDRAVKQEVFAAIDRAARDEAIVASNTSYLDVFPLIPAARQPRAAIAHWYTPPYIIDLVDLAPGPETRPEVIDTLRDFYAGLGKRPVVFETLISGYIANRLQAAIGLEIYRLLDEGLVAPQDIDASIVHGLALRMATLGHLKKADYTGLDMARRALANRTYTPPEPKGGSATLDRLIAAGRSGVMAGAGFYDYGGRPAVDLFRERDVKLLKLKRALRAIEEGEADAAG